MRGRTTWLSIGVLALALACDSPPEISDTGYVGTWGRGNERVRSNIAIVEHSGGYLFRWRLTSADGTYEVRCNWQGECDEVLEGQKVAEYKFRASVDPESGHLLVECNGRRLGPEEKQIHYLDELIVQPGGKKLVALNLESMGETYEKGMPRRQYDKISDSVADPPAPPG